MAKTDQVAYVHRTFGRIRQEPCSAPAQTKLRPSDKARLEKAASKVDVTPSEFIRACILMGLDDVDQHDKAFAC